MRQRRSDGTVAQAPGPPRDRAFEGGSFIVDARGVVLGFDPGMEQLTGWPAMDVVGRHKDLAGTSTAGPPLYAGALRAGGLERREVLLGCRDGSSVEVEAIIARHPGEGDRSTVTVLRVLARSGRPADAAGTEICDPLTGLAPREPFGARLEEELRLAASHGRPVALVLADIDHLRRVNDRFGREAGDGVLRKVAGIIRATVADEHHLARIGDDDFAVLLPGAGRGEARQLAARLRSTVERFRFLGLAGDSETSPRITMSLGAASFPADADNAVDLLGRAREALDEARALGRNRVWCYTRRPRVPLRSPVYFDGVELLLVGYAQDLSPSGIFVQTSVPVDIGMRCALAFPLPSSDGNVHVIGRVVRTVPVQEAGTASDSRVPGMGIEFERFGPQDRRAIEAYLYENESTSLRPENGSFSVRPE